MVTEVTDGVSVSVETFYQPNQSSPPHSEYLFAYRITIENQTAVPLQLISRHWYIKDSNCDNREVAGDGVVGQQPIIDPGQSYQYISAAQLKSDIGKMYGTYEMENLYNKRRFTVNIPTFKLVTPFKLN